MILIEPGRDDMIENLLFGYMDDNTQHWLLNVITCHAKHIYCEKQKEQPDICFYRFLPKLASDIEREQKILYNNIRNFKKINAIDII